MYKEKHIRTLHQYLKECIKNEKKKENPDEEGINKLLNLQRAIEAIYFNPLLFNDMFEQYDLGDIVMLHLENIPLYINDLSLLHQSIINWRIKERV